MSRVKIEITPPWKFNDFSVITVEKDTRFDIVPSTDPKKSLYGAPLIKSIEI